MATITRGHGYDLTSIVNAQSLNDLVQLATIAGLTVADIPGGNTVQISVGSAPSGAADGWVSAQYELLRTASNASFSLFNYVLSTPMGQVALFNPYGLETRRLYNGESTFAVGAALVINTGAAGVTLTSQSTYATGVPVHWHVGGTPSTAPSGSFVRLVMKGVIPANVVDAGGAVIRKYYYLLNAATAQYQHSAGVTNTDKVLGISLDHRLEGDTRIPAFIFGAPTWRA